LIVIENGRVSDQSLGDLGRIILKLCQVNKVKKYIYSYSTYCV